MAPGQEDMKRCEAHFPVFGDIGFSTRASSHVTKQNRGGFSIVSVSS